MALVLHDHAVRRFGNHTHVVGDHDQTHAVLHLKPHQQIENLLLDRHVESRRRFVCDKELGIASNRNRDHDALALAARHLMREAFQAFRRIANADEFQKLNGAGTACRAVHAHMLLQHFLKLIPDREAGIEACDRFLENHRNVAADDLAAFLVGHRLQVLTVEGHDICGNGR